jgi:hypothetical protein
MGAGRGQRDRPRHRDGPGRHLGVDRGPRAGVGGRVGQPAHDPRAHRRGLGPEADRRARCSTPRPPPCWPPGDGDRQPVLAWQRGGGVTPARCGCPGRCSRSIRSDLWGTSPGPFVLRYDPASESFHVLLSAHLPAVQRVASKARWTCATALPVRDGRPARPGHCGRGGVRRGDTASSGSPTDGGRGSPTWPGTWPRCRSPHPHAGLAGVPAGSMFTGTGLAASATTTVGHWTDRPAPERTRRWPHPSVQPLYGVASEPGR